MSQKKMVEKKMKNNGRHMNWVVLDDNTHTLTRDLLDIVKKESGSRIAFTDMIFQLIKNVDEEKFIEWLTGLKTAHKGGEISAENKTKILKMLKGGRI